MTPAKKSGLMGWMQGAIAGTPTGPEEEGSRLQSELASLKEEHEGIIEENNQLREMIDTQAKNLRGLEEEKRENKLRTNLSSINQGKSAREKSLQNQLEEAGSELEETRVRATESQRQLSVLESSLGDVRGELSSVRGEHEEERKDLEARLDEATRAQRAAETRAKRAEQDVRDAIEEAEIKKKRFEKTQEMVRSQMAGLRDRELELNSAREEKQTALEEASQASHKIETVAAEAAVKVAEAEASSEIMAGKLRELGHFWALKQFCNIALKLLHGSLSGTVSLWRSHARAALVVIREDLEVSRAEAAKRDINVGN